MYWRDIFTTTRNFYSIRAKNKAEEKSKSLKLTVKKEKRSKHFPSWNPLEDKITRHGDKNDSTVIEARR